MARNMAEKSTDLFRTVVKTTFLEDSIEKTWKYDKDYELVTVPLHVAGDMITEVFGPYQANAQNQNYSIIKTFRVVETGEKLYKREQFPGMTDYQWNGSYYETATKRDYVKTATQVAQHQKLKPVFAINANGTLSQALDWVDY